MTLDTTKLTALINNCFDLSMAGDLSDDQRTSFLAAGKQLRGSLMNLISAQFNDGTPAVIDANTKLTTVNQEVTEAKNNLEKADGILADVNQLIGVLDGLLKLATAFH